MTLPDSTNDLGGIEFGPEQPDWFMDLQDRQREAGQMNDSNRAAPMVDADAVTSVASGIAKSLRTAGLHVTTGAGKKVYPDWVEITRAALSAAAPDAGFDLDKELDSVHPEAAASLQFIQPYLITDPEPYWQAHVSVPTGGLSGFQKHRGTGPTRTAAIQAAAANARKGAEQ